jgi:hypothetical protein
MSTEKGGKSARAPIGANIFLSLPLIVFFTKEVLESLFDCDGLNFNLERVRQFGGLQARPAWFGVAEKLGIDALTVWKSAMSSRKTVVFTTSDF